MPDVRLTLENGNTVSLTMPEPGTGPSAFLVSLPKAGSTLFYRLMQPIANRAGLPYFSLPNELHAIGVPGGDIREGMDDVFKPTGYTFGGFRGFERGMVLPDYADGRTVLLVRDPRDMLTSLYFSEAKSHVPPGASASDALLKQFEARRQNALTTAIDDFALQRASGLFAAYQGVFAALEGKAHKLFRYEDVIFEKRRWIEEVMAYLGMTVAEQVITNVVAKNDVRPSTEDEGQHIRKVAPGDHLDKLKPETIAALDEKFAPLLDRFGYARSSGTAAPAPEPAPSPETPAIAATPEERAEALRAERRAERVAQRQAERRAARGQ
jgi:hypothetical protein